MNAEASELLSHVASPFPRPAAEPRDFLDILAVKERERITLVRLAHVDWIETAGNYVRLHARGRHYLHREPLSHLAQRLDPHRFIRIQRSAIVNLDQILHLQQSLRGRYVVTLHDGTRLTMTAPFRANFERIVGTL